MESDPPIENSNRHVLLHLHWGESDIHSEDISWPLTEEPATGAGCLTTVGGELWMTRQSLAKFFPDGRCDLRLDRPDENLKFLKRIYWAMRDHGKNLIEVSAGPLRADVRICRVELENKKTAPISVANSCIETIGNRTYVKLGILATGLSHRTEIYGMWPGLQAIADQLVAADSRIREAAGVKEPPYRDFNFYTVLGLRGFRRENEVIAVNTGTQMELIIRSPMNGPGINTKSKDENLPPEILLFPVEKIGSHGGVCLSMPGGHLLWLSPMTADGHLFPSGRCELYERSLDTFLSTIRAETGWHGDDWVKVAPGIKRGKMRRCEVTTRDGATIKVSLPVSQLKERDNKTFVPLWLLQEKLPKEKFEAFWPGMKALEEALHAAVARLQEKERKLQEQQYLEWQAKERERLEREKAQKQTPAPPLPPLKKRKKVPQRPPDQVMPHCTVTWREYRKNFHEGFTLRTENDCKVECFGKKRVITLPSGKQIAKLAGENLTIVEHPDVPPANSSDSCPSVESNKAPGC